MQTYIARRIVRLIPTLFVISIVLFIIINLAPGTYIDVLSAQIMKVGGGGRKQLEAIKERYGLDRPLHIQYIRWVSNLLRGNLGWSFLFDAPVNTLIGQRFVLTLILVIGALIFSWGVGIPLGIYSAIYQYSVGDYLLSFFGFIGLALPNFLFALFLLVLTMFVFGGDIMGGLFSPEFVKAPWSLAKILDLIKHLWAPILVLGTYFVAEIMRIMRSQMLDVLNEPFLKTVRSKGLSERIVIIKHAVPVAINPLISYAGIQIPRLVGHTVIVSIVLDLSTLGPLYYEGLLYRDMFLVGSTFLLLSLVLLLGNLVADLLLAFTDPRIRYA